MNDLEALQALWRTTPIANEPTLGKEDLMALIEARTSDIRRTIRRRLHRDAAIYLMLVALPVVHAFEKGFDAGRIGFLAFMLFTAGALALALEIQARRLRSIELSRSLRASLTETLQRVGVTIKLYMALYMLMVVTFLGALVAVVAWRFPGEHLAITSTVLASIAFAWWSCASGKRYLHRLLGRYRAPLEASLRELDGLGER